MFTYLCGISNLEKSGTSVQDCRIDVSRAIGEGQVISAVPIGGSAIVTVRRGCCLLFSYGGLVRREAGGVADEELGQVHLCLAVGGLTVPKVR